MPELHKLTPLLGVLQDQGFHVALVTDGRMSGASGKVPAAIHVIPECLAGGPLAKLRDGDIVRLDAEHGVLEAEVDAVEWRAREHATADLGAAQYGFGRELFAAFRAGALSAEEGAMTFYAPPASGPRSPAGGGTSATPSAMLRVHDQHYTHDASTRAAAVDTTAGSDA